MEQNLMDRAREYAVKAHGEQKYGKHPYVVHLDDVAGIVRSVPGWTEEQVAAAYLHDVLEDTTVTTYDLQCAFGFDVTLMVEFCTDEPGKNRREKKLATFRRNRQILAEGTPLSLSAALVKLADRLANLRACIRNNNHPMLDMYRKERETFYLAHFITGCDSLWEEYNRILADN